MAAMGRKRIVLVLALGFLGLCPAFLSAQSYRSFSWEMRQILERARFRLGPLRLWPAIYLRNVGYDDNVYRETIENDPVRDFTATLSPEIRGYLLVGQKLILSFLENPEYMFFGEQTRERRWNNTISPELKILLFRNLVVSGKYTYSNRRRRASSEFDVRANELRSTYQGGLHFDTARESSVGVTFESANISYEDVRLPGQDTYLSQRLNREERSISSEIYYQIFNEGFFFVTGSYTDYLFKAQAAQSRDSYSYQVSSGIRFPLLGRIRGTVSLGFKNFYPKNSLLSGYSGMVGRADLDIRIRRFGFQVDYERDVRFSYWQDNVFFLEDRFGGGLSFYLFRFLRLDYSLTYGQLHYPDTFFVRLPDESYAEIDRLDKYTTHTLGFAYRLVGSTAVGIRFNFWNHDSNLIGWNRSNMVIGGYLTYDF